jgi:Helix-turn-helix domain/RodZ C-terminal domain
VFEIGTSLRDARERQGIELSRIERETRIRTRYLKALEDEQFDVLPGAAYAKGFLRTYAEFLGLDGERFVDEFNTRFPATEEPPALPPTAFRRRRLALDARLLVLPFAVLLALIGWQIASEGGHRKAQLPPPPRTTATATVRTPPPVQQTRPAVARLTLAAVRGPCWISVRLGSERGRLLFERTLEPGGTARFAARRLWIRLGAPWNLDATLNGTSVQLPAALGNVTVTPTRVAAIYASGPAPA